MFKQLSTYVIQHLIAQNSWAAPILQPFASQSVLLDFVMLKTSLVVLENGSLAAAGVTNMPDATITIPPGLLLRLLARDESAKLQIKVDGDTQLATALAKVLSQIRWDYEDDFSKLVGDIPASKIGAFARHTARTAKDNAINLANMLSEYWQEENPMLAKKRHVDQFNAEVDNLRADVARMEKRLEKLARTQGKTANPDNPVS